jgi:hypothetical protein
LKKLRGSKDSVESKLRDSIIALRLLGFESSKGQLASFAHRLRTILTIGKLLDDNEFPSNSDELKAYNSGVLLAPEFTGLKSIFSTATLRSDAADKRASELKGAQKRIELLWAERLMVTNGLKDLTILSPTHRTSIEPKPSSLLQRTQT